MKSYKLCFLFLFTLKAFGQDKKAFEIPQDLIHQIATINPDTSYNVDLAFLENVVKGKKIILLGGKGSESGPDFLLKTRIIKYLAAKQGFKTIAFDEGSFYVLNNPAMAKELNNLPFDSLINYAFTEELRLSEEFKPMTELIRSKSVKLLGLDNQLRFLGYQTFFEDFQNYLLKYKVFSDTVFFRKLNVHCKTILRNKTGHPLGYMDDEEFLNQLNERMKAEGQRLSLKLDTIKTRLITLKPKGSDFYVTSIDNLKDEFSAFTFKPEYNVKKIIEQQNLYSKRMFLNLQWYLATHPSEKIIIWTSSFQSIKSLGLIQYSKSISISELEIYKNTKNLGNYLVEKYGTSGLHLGIIYGQGDFGLNTGDKQGSLAPLTQETPMEYQLNTSGTKFAYLNLKDIKLPEDGLKARIFDVHKAKWGEAFDGLFYIGTLKSSARRK